MTARIKLRRDTASNWTSNNPTLALGEPGYETDTRKLKVGDGSTAWNSLSYAGGVAITNNGSIDIGNYAGNSGQSCEAIAIGHNAGRYCQGYHAVAVGMSAGHNCQGFSSVAIGRSAGASCQAHSSVAIGHSTGQCCQHYDAVAVGAHAGQYCQSHGTVAVGHSAGECYQSWHAVAVGKGAGGNHQGHSSVAIGHIAGLYYQKCDSVAVGSQSGKYHQGNGPWSSGGAIAIGSFAGRCCQEYNAVAIGKCAGNCSQGYLSVAIGKAAGACSQGHSSVAVGHRSGVIHQGYDSVAVGTGAGQYHQCDGSTALGYQAGQCNQSYHAIAIGANAGNCNQGLLAVAVGRAAGSCCQGTSAVAIGHLAGACYQNGEGVAIGTWAGKDNQGFGAIAIGGHTAQGQQQPYAIAVGTQAVYTYNWHYVNWASGNGLDYTITISNNGDYQSIRPGMVLFNNGYGWSGNNLATATGTDVDGNLIYATNTLQANQAVIFANDLNTIRKNVVYYVLATNLTGSQFSVSTSPGGSPVIINGNSSGQSVAVNYVGTLITDVAVGMSTTVLTLATLPFSTPGSGAQFVVEGFQGSSAIALGSYAAHLVQHPESIVINATGSELASAGPRTTVMKTLRTVSGGSAPGGFSPVYYNPTTGELIVVTP